MVVWLICCAIEQGSSHLGNMYARRQDSVSSPRGLSDVRAEGRTYVSDTLCDEQHGSRRDLFRVTGGIKVGPGVQKWFCSGGK